MTGLLQGALFLLIMLPTYTDAHSGHGASAWLKSARWDGDKLALVVEILNEGGATLTLRHIAGDGARTVTFTRQRSVLGIVTEQPVEFLRLDPNELARLGDGRYRLALAGLDADAAQVKLTLDFGPDGTVPVAVPVPVR
ncbi:hypothetical protein BAL199_13418 [alpha proteobacterium BAL199]|jgi:copper(I)-binding protein|nr:hypothetical protein BAL199_13418 [alpha proteobacterium BAL199]